MAGWLGGVRYAATRRVARMATTLRPGLSLGFWITLGALLLWLSLQERGQLSRRRILGLASGVALGIGVGMDQGERFAAGRELEIRVQFLLAAIIVRGEDDQVLARLDAA